MHKLILSTILTVIFTFFFTKTMTFFFGDEYSGFKKREKVKYVVKQKEGAVACITENIYLQIQDYSKKNNQEAIKNEIKNGNCIILNNGDELEALEGICNIRDKNIVKSFKTKKFILHNLYLPCFAVEMKKIIPTQDANS